MIHEERRKRFESFLNHDAVLDDDEYELVSSAMQGIDWFLDDDDDIEVVTTLPSIDSATRHAERLVSDSFHLRSKPTLASLWAIAAVAGVLVLALRKQLARKCSGYLSKNVTRASDHHVQVHSTSTKGLVEFALETPDGSTHKETIAEAEDSTIHLPTKSEGDHVSALFGALPASKIIIDPKHDEGCRKASSLPEDLDCPGQLHPPKVDNLHSMACTSLETTEQTNHLSATSIRIITQSDGLLQRSDRASKEQIASQIAKDIKLVENVLAEHGLDKSIAPQLAIGMQSSQHIVNSQRDIEFKRMMVDSHEKQLDRQLSQQQHDETLQAAQYDPDWRDKLQRGRDRCWDAVSRLVWDMTVTYHITGSIQPLLEWYRFRRGVWTFQEVAMIIVYNLCSCTSHSHSVATNSSGSTSTSVLLSAMGYDASVFEEGRCYAYCGLSATLILISILLSHQALRGLSMPPVCHHIVNASGAAFLCSRSQIQLLRVDANLVGVICFVLTLFALVHSRYSASYGAVAKAASENRTIFPTCLRDKLERLDELHTHLCLFRYLLVAFICSSMLLSNLDDLQATIDI